MKRLVLLGAGHAHLVALKRFARHRLPDTELVLISPANRQYYSGMVPGWIAGHYALDQCRVPVQPMIDAAGGQFIAGRVHGLNAAANEVTLEGGQRIAYDFVSIDVGATSNMLELAGDNRLGVKPIEHFCQRWQIGGYSEIPVLSVAVLGGGAAGVELAMAIAHARRFLPGTRLVLVAGDKGVLPDFRAGFRRRVVQRLSQLGIDVINAYADIKSLGLMLSDGRKITADLVLVATGAQALPFLKASGLAVDSQGFVRVDSDHRSVSHHNVFAAGDTCSREDGCLDRSGVHAVRAGPVLASNLAAAVSGQATAPFYPRRYSLYLLAAGSQWAIGSYGPLAFSGSWVWRWKDRIDRAFVAGFPLGAQDSSSVEGGHHESDR